MSTNRIELIELNNNGDNRGTCYSFPIKWKKYLNEINDIHFLELVPNKIRGNHYHSIKNEIIFIKHKDKFTLFWRDPKTKEVKSKCFNGKGAILLKIPTHISHAIKNNGEDNIEIVAISNKLFNEKDPDIVKDKLI